MVLKVLRDLGSRSDKSEDGIREYNRRGNYRIIIIAEGVLGIILYITKF